MPPFPNEFPEELLHKIVSYFESSFDETWRRFDSECDINTRTIQSLRLTCKRLCQISSPLLIPYIHISPNLSSLDRVDEVLKSPTISQGLRRIFVDVRMLEPRDFENFFMFRERMLRDMLGDPDMRRRGAGLKGREFFEEANRVRWIMEELYTSESYGMISFLLADELNEHQLSIKQGFQQEHAHHQKLYQEQMESLRSGRFMRTLASAAAGIRPGVCVYISDEQKGSVSLSDLTKALRKHGDREVDFNFVIKFTGMDDRQSWSDWGAPGWDDQTRKSLQSILYELPPAMRAAGGNLTGFMVDMGGDLVFPERDMTQKEVSALEQGSRSLKTFHFQIEESMRIKPVSTFLSAVIGSGQISNLSLDLKLDTPDYSTVSSKPSTIGLLRLPETCQSNKLKTLSLKKFDMHLGELKKLLSVLKSETDIIFYEVTLLSGTWAEALDCIRSKAGVGSRLMQPRGSEVYYMRPDDRVTFFGSIYRLDQVGRAEEYVRSSDGVKNPLHEWNEARATNAWP